MHVHDRPLLQHLRLSRSETLPIMVLITVQGPITSWCSRWSLFAAAWDGQLFSALLLLSSTACRYVQNITYKQRAHSSCLPPALPRALLHPLLNQWSSITYIPAYMPKGIVNRVVKGQTLHERSYHASFHTGFLVMGGGGRGRTWCINAMIKHHCF